MIEVINLTKKYGSFTAVDNISFTVEKGSIYGFLGPNGAGKTTTMNVITGCLAATSGTVKINGIDIFDEPEEAKALIGYLPELPPLYSDLTPKEQLRFVCDLRGIPSKEADAEIRRCAQAAGITEVENRLIRFLSKGYCQRVGLASALIGDPPILILDEPTVGLDPRQIIEMRGLIKKLGQNHTVILSSHILSEVQAICDRIIIISGGRLTASDTTGNINRSRAGGRVEFVLKNDKPTVRKAVSKLGGLADVKFTPQTDGTLRFSFVSGTPDEARRKALAALVNGGCDVLSVTVGEMSLEDAFLEFTDGK